MHALLPMTPLLLLAEGGGFNPLDVSQGGGFLWTLIIFAVSAPFIWLVVMGPVTRALAERDSKASKAIEVARQAAGDAEKARAEVEVRLGEARAEAAALLAQARERAGVREREILEQADREAAAMVEAARRAIRAEQDKALAAIREEVVDLSISGARAVLKRNVGGEDDRRLVSDMVGQLQTAPGKRGR